MPQEIAGIDPSLPPADRVRVFLSSASSRKYKGFENDLITQRLTLVSASATPHGSVTFTMTVPSSYTNRMGNLHGGAAALIFDVCTTAALAPIARPGFWLYAGVTRNLNITYLRPAAMGEEITVYCEVVHAGMRLATIKGEIRDKSGKVLSMCEHLKASIDPVDGAKPPVIGGRL